MNISDKRYIPQQYLVCYVDMLGIREKLFNGIDYHKSEVTPEKQTEIDLYSDAIVSLLDHLNALDRILHEKAGELYDLGEKISKLKNPISKEEFINQTEKIHFSIQHFSDSTLVYAPFNPETEFVAIEMLASWMISFAEWSLACFSCGVTFRGAMTIGTAWELRPQCLFGPAIHEVYHLESETANHPRIVISSPLKKLIDQYLESGRKSGIDVDSIPTAFRMVHKDFDGVDMLHYLSTVIQTYAKIRGDISPLKETVLNAYRKLLEEYLLHYQNAVDNPGEAKLARRYWAVLRYFASRNDDWDNVLPPPNDKKQ